VYEVDDPAQWVGEYRFRKTRIWDSARRLEQGMYRAGQMQCVSFGHDKPLPIGRGGAILLDDETAYQDLLRMRYDGRDLTISPWAEQQEFQVGYHYRPTVEEAVRGLELLPTINQAPKFKQYPDLRRIIIK
jgi:dTDP-4-amino-4,6-dideoxygalactose transaminase